MKAAVSDFTLPQSLRKSIKEVDLSVLDVALDYTAAYTLAGKAAGNAMLVAWYDGKHDAGYPEVQECTGATPGWLAYAKSHGADLAVKINGGEFIFVFASGLENQGG